MVKDFNIFTNRRQRKTADQMSEMNLFHARDDTWKSIRALVSPVFTSGKLKKMFPLLKENVNDLKEVLTSHAKRGEEIELKQIYANFTFDGIAKCAFSIKTNAVNDSKDVYIININRMLEIKFWKVILIMILPIRQ